MMLNKIFMVDTFKNAGKNKKPIIRNTKNAFLKRVFVFENHVFENL